MKIILLKPKTPYNVKLHLQEYSNKEPLPHLFDGKLWRRCLLTNSNKLVPIEVEINKEINDATLKVEILITLNKEEQEEIVNKLRYIFNITYDLKPAYKIMDSDPILKQVMKKKYGLVPTFYPTVYEGIINAIIQQQISLKVAFHMTAILIKKFGTCKKLQGNEYWNFPDAKKLGNASICELRECKISERKAEYIRDFSKLVDDGKFNPEMLKKLPHHDIISKLVELRGFGRWTAEMTIVTSISFDGLNPSGDLGAKKALSHYYNKGRLMTEDEVRKFTEKWEKHQGIITYYLVAAFLHKV